VVKGLKWVVLIIVTEQTFYYNTMKIWNGQVPNGSVVIKLPKDVLVAA